MRPKKRLIGLGRKPVIKPGSLEPLRLLHRLGNTTVQAPDFQIVLDGDWNRAENPERVELRDSSGKKRLFISKWLIDARDFKQLERGVAHFTDLKRQGLQNLSPNVQILNSDGSAEREQVEARLEAHDAEAQVAIATLIRADRSVLLEMTIYEYEV